MDSNNPYKPPNAVIDVSDGYSFTFEIDGIVIRACGSGFSGKESVFLDDELVSETRTHKTTSAHEFTCGNIDYRVEFEVINMIKGQLACRLYRNDILSKLYVAAPRINEPGMAITIIVAAIAFLAITEHMDLPWWAFWVALITTIPLNMYYSMKHIEIKELQVSE